MYTIYNPLDEEFILSYLNEENEAIEYTVSPQSHITLPAAVAPIFKKQLIDAVQNYKSKSRYIKPKIIGYVQQVEDSFKMISPAPITQEVREQRFSKELRDYDFKLREREKSLIKREEKLKLEKEQLGREREYIASQSKILEKRAAALDIGKLI